MTNCPYDLLKISTNGGLTRSYEVHCKDSVMNIVTYNVQEHS